MKQSLSRGLMAAILLGSALCAAPVQAQNAAAAGARIGFVNTDRILQEALPAKDAQAKLEQEFSRREKTISDAGQALKAASDQFERDGATLSESQRQARQRELTDKDRDLQRQRREFQEDLGARKQEELQHIIDRVNRVIKQIAEAEKYDAVFQEAAYINPRLDITDQVIKALNASK